MRLPCLGSVVAVSDSAGSTVETYAYSVYGRVQVTVFGGAGTGNPYMFTGRRLDAETGLYYYRARLYSPYIGRFLQTDPIGYADGINWYLYCGNNPLILVDPFGLGGDSFWNEDYVGRSFKQLGLGNYTEDVTFLGTGMQVAAGIAGIDLPLDVRDIYYDTSHWQWSWGHVGQTALDAVALAPVIGALKFSDEVAALGKNARRASKAADATSSATKALGHGYDILPYNQLRRSLRGTGLVSHHIIDKRFANVLGVKQGSMKAIALTSAEHQKFTNAWRRLIPYGTDYKRLTPAQVRKAAKTVYKDHPEILKTLSR